MSHFRIIFIVTALITMTILTIQIRVINDHNFYKLRSSMVEQARIKQSLYQKIIKLENLTNSSFLIDFVDEDSDK